MTATGQLQLIFSSLLSSLTSRRYATLRLTAIYVKYIFMYRVTP